MPTVPTVPTVAITGDSVVCGGRAGQLSATATAPVSRYAWNTGATTATVTITRGGTYSVRVTYADGAEASATHLVRESSPPCGPVPLSLRIPSIITPNGDGKNDRFYIAGVAGTGWTLAVYNRWGKQVYFTANYQHEWDAEAIGGLYYYTLRPPQAARVYKGWVEVVR
ncbi:gliding motility-associated C-terminal domain-containing protein [Hymenobacter sp. HDW8]|uniref:gliding motility-associated C-terminal domain-containing protein n=1 Tax=Hymenobacter sp. HDW8 TaxID=2714932 RepID=UPI001409B442|nr:gliding motility-associated C-terminal domain-containing protein [Hymenobacter sp. HDW8]QIL78312.1 gliding motility-associated C-terminal domain-containing protein [Hymenobacter sp. HDW8]